MLNINVSRSNFKYQSYFIFFQKTTLHNLLQPSFARWKKSRISKTKDILREVDRKLTNNVFSQSHGDWMKTSIFMTYRLNRIAVCRILYENTPIQIHKQFHLQKLNFFQIKSYDIFNISAQNIDCGYSLEPPRRGGSNEYPQSIFLSRNKKNNVYPCKPPVLLYKSGV